MDSLSPSLRSMPGRSARLQRVRQLLRQIGEVGNTQRPGSLDGPAARVGAKQGSQMHAKTHVKTPLLEKGEPVAFQNT